MKKIKRTLSALLALLCIGSAMISCSGENTPAETSVSSDTTSAAETTVPETTVPKPNLPETDFEGREVPLLTWAHGTTALNDFYTEGLNGDQLNDAIHVRNTSVEEEYNVTLKIVEMAQGVVRGEVESAVMSGDDLYTFVNIGLNDANAISQRGYLYDLHTLDNIDLDMMWWDQRCNEEMSVMGKLFMTMGDINIMDNSETRAVIFNRDLVDDFGLESPYDLVNNGTWTLDIMYEMMKKVSADTNGDGAMDHKDRWGMISEPANMWQHYLGSGEKSISKDDDDLPYLTFNTDRGIAVMEKVHEIITDEQNTILTSHVVNMPNYWVEVLYPMFANDQALFFATAVGNTYKQLREMDSIFGVLPNPKFEETQDEYYNVLSDVWATTVSVPISCQDPDFSAFMLEALAAASVTTNSRTFNEVIFVNKGLRDEESIAMAKLIADTHVFDLGVFNNWYGLYYILSDIGSSESMNFASKYAASESGIIGAMEKTINLYKELDNK